jgi:hypothetical protein
MVLFYRILGLVLFGVMSRLLPHPPNFTAVSAIALLSICSLGSVRAALGTVFAILFLSDGFFGFHSTLLAVYVGFASTVLLGYGLKVKRTLWRTLILLIASTLLFFLIANFGVWFQTEMYPKTPAGLALCYLAALPFLLNQLFGALCYGVALFAWLEFSEHNRYELAHP